MPPGDLLHQAVEGMERPLFVLDEDWRFAYINPAGAAVLARDVGALVGRDIWVEFPEAVGGPFDELYRTVRRTGRPGVVEAWFGPLEKWFRADAFLTDAGLIVSYDDVTERRRADDERLAPFRALSPREQAVLAGLLAGDSAETIAHRSYVSLATVRSQIRAVLLKLGVNSQLAAVALAREAGWEPG